MSISLFRDFEEIKRGNISLSDLEVLLATEEYRNIHLWCLKYMNIEKVDLRTECDFLYDLYLYENIDYSSPERFLSFVTHLSQRYGIDTGLIMPILSEYRSLDGV